MKREDSKHSPTHNSASSFSRRDFLRGGLAASALAMGAATLTGCGKPQAVANGAETLAATGNEELDAITARLVERVPGADLPDARPIAPVEPPAQWDDEADVVIVGVGGGGIVATAFLATQGLKVIGIEKEGMVGGASRHACTFANVYGGSLDQNELEFAVPTFPPDVKAFMRLYEQDNSYSIDEPYLKNMLELSGEACDWIMGQNDMNMVCLGPIWHDIDVHEGRQNVVLGMNNPTNAMEAVALDAGADIRLNTPCTALVYDGERVVGVEIEEDGKKSYVKGERGVILCAGGFGMNRDLIKAYLPSAYEGTVQGGPMAYHTGEAFRMGLGLGADFAGFDSWSCWEAAIDEETAGGDGQFWHYFWHGERQLFHNPWLIIDKRGRRQPYFAQTQELFANPGGQMGDLSNCAAWMSAVGHRVYSICDSDFATNIFEKNVLLPTQSDRNRIPLTDPDVLIDTKGLVTADWLAEVDEAVARGAVKKADTIEELADMLLLDRDVLKSAVDEYNEVCEKGVDDQLSTPYDPSWLHAIKNPPFYGAILGGQMAKTMCGLRTDERLQVMREDGSLIGGLFANATTAGGLSGEANYGCFWNSTVFGGVGTSWITGYIAAKSLLESAS